MGGVLFVLLTLLKAWAHPTYIRLGYASCTGCHVSSMGAGLLTPYGQGVSVSQSLWAEDPEELPEKQYLLAFQGRVLHLRSEEEARTFPMQLDVLVQLKLHPRALLEATLAVAPKPKDEAPEDETPAYQRLYFRSLAAVWRLPTTLEQRLRLGLGILPLGVGMVDHTVYTRAENRLQVVDNPIALTHFVSTKAFEAHHFVFVAHPSESQANAEHGAGAQLWWRPLAQLSLGGQGLAGESQSIRRRLAGALLKLGHGPWALLAEVNRSWRELVEDRSEFRQWTWLAEASVFPWEPLRLYLQAQGLERDRAFLAREQRHSAGLELKLLAHLTLQLEQRRRVSQELQEQATLAQLFINGW